MIETLIFNHRWQYEANRLIRSFFPPQKFTMELNSPPAKDMYMYTDYQRAEIKDGEIHIVEYSEKPSSVSDEDEKLAVCRAIYKVLSHYTGKKPDWGLLTGVRPIKYILKKREKGVLNSYFNREMLVNEKKLKIADKVIETQLSIRKKIDEKGFSLYVSIPFCPSRCDYCSFVSHSVETEARLIPLYIEKLIKELDLIRQISEEGNLKLQSIFIGGGTPTSISPLYLEEIFRGIEKFNLSNLLEYTLEAGRPETISAEKLKIAKDYGITRLCINPQTLSNEVLQKIGRNHTDRDFYNAFNLAKKIGFENINTDLIGGLPTDNYDGFCETLRRITELSPLSITIHCLTLKRSSNLYKTAMPNETKVSEMAETAYSNLINKDYLPYYLYRQNNTLENLENIGYAKYGAECFYNVISMEDLGNILAVGSGASTKIIDPLDLNVKRIYNHKYPYEYIEDFSALLQRKRDCLIF